MKDFISEIRRINTDGLIYAFSEKSIDMYKNNQFTQNIEIPIIRYGKRKKMIVQLSAWDIQNIVFLSVKMSNDYRHADKMSSMEWLISLYRDYENEHSSAEDIQNTNGNEVFRIVLGMTAEQSAKLSGKTMSLVADLGAVADVPFDTAMDDFKSALMGNYEAMDKYGISLSANQLQQSEYVKSLGKTWNQLSENEKMMAAYYEITRQGASAQGLAAQEANSFGMQMRLLKESIGETVGELGSVLLPLLEPVVQKFQQVVDKIREWVQEHPKLAQGIMVAVGAIGLLMAVLGPIIMLVGTILVNLTVISALFTGALAPAILAGVAAFGQFIAIAAIVGLAIAAIIQIGQYLIENWDQIKANAIEVWNNIWSVITAVAQGIWNVVTTAWEGLKSDTLAAWDFIKNSAITIWEAIKTHIIQPVQDAWSKAQEIWNNLKTSCQNAWDTIKGYAQTAWNAVKTNIITPIQSAWSTVSSTVSNIVSSCQNAWNTVKGAAKSAWDAVKKAISDPINKARDAVKKAMDAIKRAVNVNLKPNLKLPHISVSGKLSINPPSVPKISVECSAVA